MKVKFHKVVFALINWNTTPVPNTQNITDNQERETPSHGLFTNTRGMEIILNKEADQDELTELKQQGSYDLW